MANKVCAPMGFDCVTGIISRCLYKISEESQ
jgi:hypothetical protein